MREEVEVHARQVRRATQGSGQLGDEATNPALDVVADDAYGVDSLPGGVVELPVLVALAGKHRARIPAPHRDDHVRGPYCVGGEQLRAFGGDVDTHFSHRFDYGGVELVGGFGAGGADLDLACRHSGEVGGGH